MSDWLGPFAELAAWLAGISALMFVASLVALPVLIARMDADYFVRGPRSRTGFRAMHPIARALLVAVKNVLGAILVLAGLAMLVLPGQGLLSIFLGVSLLSFPGKRRLELWLIRRPHVLRVVNWIRRRADTPPLLLPDEPKG